jgi:hypothetical protein
MDAPVASVGAMTVVVFVSQTPGVGRVPLTAAYDEDDGDCTKTSQR